MNNIQGSQDQECDIYQSFTCKYSPSTENEYLDQQYKQENTEVQSSIYSEEQRSILEQSEFHYDIEHISNVHQIQFRVQEGIAREKKQKETIIDDIQDSESEQHYDFNDQFNERDRINNTLGIQINSEWSDDNSQSERSLLQLNSNGRRESQSSTLSSEPYFELIEDNDSQSDSYGYGSSQEDEVGVEVEEGDFVSDDSQDQYPPFDCSICLDLQPLKTIIYNCSHEFHAVCINHWIFRKKSSCPICRKDLKRTNLKI